FAETPFGAVTRDPGYFLLLRGGRGLGIRRFRRETNNLQGREMLARVRGLLHGDGIFALDDEPVEVLPEQYRDSLRHCAHDPVLGVVDFVQNSERAVLKDRIGIQYEEPGFHKSASKGKKVGSRKLALPRREPHLAYF